MRFLSKTLLANLALLTVSLGFSFAAGEFVLRRLGYYGVREARVERIRLVDDEVVDYRRVPNTAWIFNNLRYHSNQHGWRDYDYDYAKSRGVYRILVIGDSVTNGYGVALDEIYVKQLEKRLNAAATGRRFEVLILSLGALNTTQEVHLLEVEGLAYEPDLVIVGYVLNDPASGSSLREGKTERESLVFRAKAALSRSSLLHFSYRQLQALYASLARRAGWEPESHHIESDYFASVHANPKRWGQVTSGFERLAGLSERVGFPVVVAIFPVLYELDDYPWAAVHDQVAALARRHDMEVVDLLPALAGHPEGDLQVDFGDFVHPSPLGHRLAADALYEHLAAAGVLTATNAATTDVPEVGTP